MFLPLLPTLSLSLLASAAPVQDDQAAPEVLRLDVRAPLPSAEEIAMLPPDGGPEFNRLIFEKSPYLRQHARNPVDWWPWCDEAFAKAAELDWPVYVSLGYSSCHWCHVMERESFMDDMIAEGLNTQYIAIKVDREERPDLDAILMAYCSYFGKRGGWPLNVFLTPDKEPFWVNAFMPREGTISDMGMMQVLPYIARGWRGQRRGIHNRSQQVMGDVAKSMAKSDSGMQVKDGINIALRDLVERYDQAEGGWGFVDKNDNNKFYPSPKFPVGHNIRFLLRHAERTGNEQARTMAVTTLHKMARGGMRDLISGGFHRYATDQFWRHPHWEKLIHDQFTLAMAYAEGYEATGDPFLKEVGTQTLDYVLSSLTNDQGAFMMSEDAENTEDANSGQSFSLFYTWEELEVMLAMESDNDITFATSVFGLQEDGNFYDERTKALTGRNLISLIAPREVLAPQMYPQFETAEEQLEAFDRQYARVMEQLRAARAMRVHPLVDEKVLTSYNGLGIAAFAMAGRAFGEQRYIDVAERAMGFLEANLRMPAPEGDPSPQRFYHRWIDGEAAILGYAHDHVNVCLGQLELYRATQDPQWLAAAKSTADLVYTYYWDHADGGVFTTASDAEVLYVRPREEQDTSTPSANSVFAECLLRLARLTGDMSYQRDATAIFDFQSGRMKDAASWRCHMFMAFESELGETSELVIVGAESDPKVQEALRTLSQGYYPGLVVVHREPGEDPGPIGAVAPYTQTMTGAEGEVNFFLCRNRVCDLPTQDFEEVLRQLAGESDQMGPMPEDG